MTPVSISGAGGVEFPEIQKLRIRRRIAASDAVASLVAELVFGPSRREDDADLAVLTASRIAERRQ